MKRIFLAVALILFTGIGFNNVYAEDYLIGFVNAQRLIVDSPQAEKVQAQLEKEFSNRQTKLIADQKKQKQMEDRLSKDAAIMSESERSKLERDIILLRKDNKRNSDEYKEDVTFRRNEELRKIYKEIGEAIDVIAKQHKLDLVLNESAVAYVSPKIDITNLVLDYLKNKDTKPAK